MAAFSWALGRFRVFLGMGEPPLEIVAYSSGPFFPFRLKQNTSLYTLFKIDPTRSGDVLIEVLGKEFNGVLGCDYFSAYRRYQREFDVSLQFCLAHLM